MGKKYDFQYIVIGSGPAGSAASIELAKRKKRVAIIEGRFFGGANLNTRDLPYAVALDFSHTYHKILSYPELGNQDIHFNFPTVSARQLKVVVEAGGNNKQPFEQEGITCIKGFANFLDKHTVAVNGQKYTADFFILATGAKLKVLEIAGTDNVDYLTPESAIKVRRLPKVVAVVGAGASGCEIAEYYAELGAKTLLFDMAEHILPREDIEVGTTLTNYFAQKLGITVLPNCRVVALEEDAISKRIIFRSEDSEKTVRVDTIVLATGSQPNLDYGLENANVKYRATGIIVDKYFQTSAKNIYAIGDCLGQDSSTERARQEGLALANILITKSKTPLNYQGFTKYINTFPEVAVVGLNEYDLAKRDRKYKKCIVDFETLAISHIENFHHGFVKLITDKNNRLIGATVVAPNANLIAAELALAVRHGLTALELASTPHVFNSYSYAIKIAAKGLAINKRKK